MLIVGAGAAGLCAALAAHEAGAECVVIERDAVPRGSTALSAGLIPAAGTRFQRERGIADDAELFAADIQRKAHGRGRRPRSSISSRAAPLRSSNGSPMHTACRSRWSTISTIPATRRCACTDCRRRSGAELVDRLREAVEARRHPDRDRRAPSRRFSPTRTAACGASRSSRPDGATRAHRLRSPGACLQRLWRQSGARAPPHSGDGRTRSISAMRAIAATRCSGARRSARSSRYMSGYQGHGSVAHPHGILITWAAIMEGGFQVNAQGQRFSDEAHGYSEQAAACSAKAGRHRVRHLRCAHRRHRAPVRGFSQG